MYIKYIYVCVCVCVCAINIYTAAAKRVRKIPKIYNGKTLYNTVKS